MKSFEEMSYEEVVAKAFAVPAYWLYVNGERDIEVLKEDLRRRAKERGEHREIVELALGFLDDPEFLDPKDDGEPFVLPKVMPPVGY